MWGAFTRIMFHLAAGSRSTRWERNTAGKLFVKGSNNNKKTTRLITMYHKLATPWRLDAARLCIPLNASTEKFAHTHTLHAGSWRYARLIIIILIMLLQFCLCSGEGVRARTPGWLLGRKCYFLLFRLWVFFCFSCVYVSVSAGGINANLIHHPSPRWLWCATKLWRCDLLLQGCKPSVFFVRCLCVCMSGKLIKHIFEGRKWNKIFRERSSNDQVENGAMHFLTICTCRLLASKR